MDNLLKSIPEPSRKRFLKKYNSDRENQQNLLNELYIGYFLTRTGLEIEYDRKIVGKTPDWTLLQDSNPKCIIEVFTLNPAKEIAVNQKVSNLLSQALKNLPGDRVIECEFIDNSAQYKIEDAINQITDNVKSWLETTSGDDLYINEYKINFHISSYLSPTGRDEFIFFGSLNHDPIRLRDKVLDKLFKYEKIVNEHKIPLVIAVTCHDLNMLDDIDLKQLLFGDDVMDIRFGNDFSILYQRLNGLFYEYSHILSGFIWAPYIPKITKIKLHLNPVDSRDLKTFLFSLDPIYFMTSP